MAIFGSYIQVVIRGLVSGQQWQVSPTFTVTDVDGASPVTGNFNFIRSSLSDWFIRWWNGDATILEDGISDRFAARLSEDSSITEVRVYAKTNVMDVPEQLVITGEILGTRGTGGDVMPSFMAASCYARSLRYGRKGAGMRLPILIDSDVSGNFINEATRAAIQTVLLDPLSDYATEVATGAAPLVINTEAGEILNVFNLRPCAVARVPDPTTGKPTFPYEGFGNISAVECAAWTLNAAASTQNSRKIGRGR